MLRACECGLVRIIAYTLIRFANQRAYIIFIMNYRKFGKTDLLVSEVGFGAWAIGGNTVIGSTPIGWGPADDKTSVAAIRKSLDLGITFFDTADFYGLGHSEELLGKELSANKE